VIATNLKESTLKKLAQHLWSEDVPLVVLRSYGLIGYIRIISKEHTSEINFCELRFFFNINSPRICDISVIEAHPDNELADLRLDVPFDELVQLCNSIDMDSLKDAEHSHIPYLIILYKYLKVWRSKHHDQIPGTYKEKQEFKDLISAGVRQSDESVPKFEENYEEAVKNVNSSIVKTKIPSEVQRLFEDEKCLNLNANVCRQI